jgi:hypothetical protein
MKKGAHPEYRSKIIRLILFGLGQERKNLGITYEDIETFTGIPERRLRYLMNEAGPEAIRPEELAKLGAIAVFGYYDYLKHE